MAAHSLEYFEFYKHPNESKILRTFFGNYCKISERRTESFFTITSEWNLGCQRTQEWGLQSLAVQPPTWQAVRKPKAWELGTYVLFNLVGQLLLCIADQKNQWDTTWNQSSHLLGITGARVCIGTYPRGLQTPNNSVPQRCGMPPPPPCLYPVSVPKSGSWKLAVL